MGYEVVMMGASAGGMDTLKILLSGLEENFHLPVVIVQHISAHSDNYMITYLNSHSNLFVKEAEEKENLKSGCVYVCPPNYHLLIEEDRTLSLATFEKVNYSRPSIDVLFETGALSLKKGAIGVLLTGASHDGAHGMGMIHAFGGMTVVQDPETAHVAYMPKAAINSTPVDYVLPLKDIASFLNTLSRAQVKG